MQLIRGIHNLKPEHHGCVATIGNFDGVHLGHQHVLGELAEKAASLNLPTTVILFEPQPQEYFLQEKAPGRLTRFREKITALRRLAVDYVLVLPFNQNLASLEADVFIQKILIDGLGIKHLVVGDDFKFGKNRHGDFTLLKQYGEQHDFSVVNMHTFSIDSARVSSTRIRDALKNGDLELAKTLLGRPYRMSGRVAHGHKRGRDIGFPTANIHLHRKVTPLTGVFAVAFYGVDGEPVQGVANLGTRPTVNGVRTILEVHLFDFDQDIYGKHVSVDFLKKIRDEKKFDSFDLLKQQIIKDTEVAKSFFQQNLTQ